jgi:hydroxymethylbilane synthase
VGQGAIGVECRAGESEIAGTLAPLNHPETRTSVQAERALLAELEGGCQVPLGAWARIENGEMVLEAAVLSPDGAECIRDRTKGAPENAEQLGRALARKMLDAGADRVLRLAGRTIGR